MLSLRPLTAADIPAIEPWFDDEETRHWLGGRDWPRKSLRLAGPDRHELLALLKRHFTTTAHAKPPASRSGSAETYLVAKGFKG